MQVCLGARLMPGSRPPLCPRGPYPTPLVRASTAGAPASPPCLSTGLPDSTHLSHRPELWLEFRATEATQAPPPMWTKQFPNPHPEQVTLGNDTCPQWGWNETPTGHSLTTSRYLENDSCWYYYHQGKLHILFILNLSNNAQWRWFNNSTIRLTWTHSLNHCQKKRRKWQAKK